MFIKTISELNSKSFRVFSDKSPLWLQALKKSNVLLKWYRLFPQEIKWIKRWIFIKTKFWLLIRPAITFLYFLRSMVVIPVSAGFIKMISWSTIPRIRSCNDVFCSTKNIKFFMNMATFPTKDYKTGCRAIAQRCQA